MQLSDNLQAGQAHAGHACGRHVAIHVHLNFTHRVGRLIWAAASPVIWVRPALENP